MSDDKPLTKGDERALRKELRLERRAIRNGWNVPQDMKADIITRAWSIVKSDIVDPRTAIAAARLGIDASDLSFRVIESEIRDDKLDHEEATEKTDHKIQVVYVNKIVPTNDDDG